MLSGSLLACRWSCRRRNSWAPSKPPLTTVHALLLVDKYWWDQHTFLKAARTQGSRADALKRSFIDA